MPTVQEPTRGETPGQEPKSKRSPAAIVAIVAVAVIGLVALLVVGGGILYPRRDSTTAAPTRLDRVPTDPEERFTTTVDGPVRHFAGAVGSPDRLAVRVTTEEEDQVRVIDGEGAELWRRDTDSEATVKMVGDDVIIGVPYADDEHGQLMLLDGDDGTELWSKSVLQYDRLDVFDDTVLLFQISAPTFTLAAYDWHTGDQIAERPYTGIDPGLTSLATTDGFVVVEDGELFVVNERLEAISTPIATNDLDGPGGFAYADGELLFASGRKLTKYGSDGVKEASADFEVEGIYRLQAAGESTWVFWTDNTCGALTYSGDEPKLLWQTDDCEYDGRQTVARFTDGHPLLLHNGDEPAVIDVMTGERVHSGDGEFVVPLANGFIDWSLHERTGYAWPGGDEVFSVQLEGAQYFVMLDGGYLVVDETNDVIELTVYG